MTGASAGPQPAIQVCGQCGVRWQVPRPPAYRCPRCGGNLLPPTAVKPQVRTFRWVARRPDADAPRPAPPPPKSAAPPRYAVPPRWGLVDPPPRPADVHTDRVTSIAPAVFPVLTSTAIMFCLAAVAEFGRYAVLLYNRRRLVPPQILALSDSVLWATAFLSVALSVFAAVAAACWLVVARRAHFEREGARDPRSALAILLGCLVPVANLIFPGVFLTELTRTAAPRVRRIVVVWWYCWVATVGVALFNLLWHLRDSLQDEANGVLYAATGDLVAAAMAILTIVLIRAIEGRDPLGNKRVPARWVIATDTPKDIIEPIRASKQEVMAK